MIRTLRVPAVVLGLLSLAVASPARAAVAVGDTPKLAFKAVDGQLVDAEKLKGRYVLVDFWATWCGPCMGEADHMVQVNQTYGPKGLTFVGVSLDGDLQEMKAVAKQKNFTWPQYFDGQGWGNKLAKEWGVHSIPATFLIDPDGKVAWTGHPALIDKVLSDAFAKNPPRLLDEKALAAAQEAMATVQAKLSANDPGAAIKALGQVPAAAKDDSRVAPKFGELQKQITTAADAMLADAEKLVEGKQYAKAGAKLRDIAGSMRGTPTGDKAKAQFDQLWARPDVKAALAAQAKEDKADVELAAAKKLQAAKQDDQAYAKYKWLSKEMADTAAAKSAAVEVAKYEKDAAFVKRQNETAMAGKAKSAFGLAQAYAKSGNVEMASKKYQQIIADMPGTSFAAQAEKELAALKR